jgi:hypothetical protein
MSENRYHFQKLTPVSNADISVYEDAIDFVFANNDIKNVAVSGAYSAGKSSILESYKAKHTKRRFVHLSLAHFRTPEQDNSESEEAVKESILEGKILNQLIHQIPAGKIPQTNFRVKKGVNVRSIVFLTAFASLFVGSATYLLLAEKISDYVGALPNNWVKTTLSPVASQYAVLLATFICAGCAIAIVFSLIKAQKNKNVFRKISLQGNEIEIFENDDDSFFDKYLNEVLYLFENVEADVIVFEDMDRFNANHIFERLREVNTLVNVQRRKEKGTKYVPLKFIYLLRDDIFINKDRTKFFDYIVPIVPIVDSSNSYEQFRKHFRDGSLLELFDESFLQGISLYVDDMRILKNIYNEFIVYYNRLNTTELDCNKMLAIILYKNLFPRDFNNLQLNTGFVHTVFDYKNALIDDTVKQLNQSKQAQEKEIEDVKSEYLENETEVDNLYNQNGLYYRTYPNSQVRDAKKAERKQAIQSRVRLPQLENELSLIEVDISITKSKPLRDLITRENISEVFAITSKNEVGVENKFTEIKESDYFDLLKYLIRSGYIDETYRDYLTYFYEDSLSANDKTFLRRITDRRGAEYTYALKEPKKVVDSSVIRRIEFEQEETLNFDLLGCLLQNDTIDKYAIYLKTLVAQIRATGNFEFISKYYATENNRKELVVTINEQWIDFFTTVLKGKKLPDTQIRDFSTETLYYSSDDSISDVNVDRCLSEYISDNTDYLAIVQPDIDKLIAGFSLLEVLFVSIDYETANKSLFDAVYSNDLYELNFDNIALMLRKEYQAGNEADIEHKNFTLVQSKSDSPLALYVAKNMQCYIDVAIKNCDGRISDDENIAISVLNSGELSETTKAHYIKVLVTEITDITTVAASELWKSLITKHIVSFSESNFINYFTKHGIDQTLVDFINTADNEIDFSSTADTFGGDVAEQLFDAIAICNNLKTEKYREVVADLGYYFDNYDSVDISDEKFNVLIEEKLMHMDVDGLGYVRDNYSKCLYDFIRQNLDEYLDIQTAEIFRLQEALKIITWDIDNDKKLKLLANSDEPISVIGKDYSDAITTYILKNNLDESDKTALYANYSKWGVKAQAMIASLAIASVYEIISEDTAVDDALLSLLLKNENVERELRISLFSMTIPTLNEETCSLHFDELGLSELKYIFTKSSGVKKYEKSNEVKTILEALKLHTWIYDYSEDEQNNKKYLVTKNRPKAKSPKFLD